MTVLLADEIKRLCDVNDKSKAMIDPFCPSRLRPTSYQLTLGREIHVGGVHKRLDQSDGILLEPHQVAVVSTHETLRIPRNIIARWSIRVKNIYEGLLWTGGPQVDPGWEGPLFCPIYNLAERTVVLKYREPLFTIDFTHTTPLSDEYLEMKEQPEFSRVWYNPPPSPSLAQHDIHRLRSAPFEALRELRELRHFRNVGYIALSLISLVLTFMVAALAVVAVKPTTDPDGPFLSFWPMTALVIAAVSLVVSVSSVVGIWFLWRRFRRII